MNITELEKIIAQIKRYQLEDNIRNIENWLRNLNKKQIKNFISLEIHPLKPIEKLKSLLVSAKALNGDYYLEDIKLITDAKTDEIANYLRIVAMNANSLESEYHREDMKLIADEKTDEIANYLSIVACSKDSLESEYHREDMKLIADAKNSGIANYLCSLSISVNSLESEHHKEDMKLIADAKNARAAKKIYYNIINQYVVKNKKDYVTFQEKIDAIHQNAVEYTDGDTTKELDDSVFTLK